MNVAHAQGIRPNVALARWWPVNVFSGIVLIAAWMSTATAGQHDWPMWRCDATRSAASKSTLPNDLRLLWQKDLGSRTQAWDDPLNLDLMTYDRVLEPIVMDGRMFVGFNDQDKLVALDAKTGRYLWTYYAEAPVRLPPVGYQGRVYFCSDDGFLYCVTAKDGKLVWKYSGAPSAQHAIGNRRLTSAWPARGGPVVRDDTVYFAASIWPFMGTFVYALDAETGATRWINDSTGAQYIKQPHSAPSFAGVAPQGALVATENLLLVPGGRSVPAAFERSSGKFRYFEINAGGKGTGGSFVAADEKRFYVHTRHKGTRAFGLENGVKTAFMPNEPVLSGDRLYSAGTTSDQKKLVRAYGPDDKIVWELAADGSGDLIRVGDQLVAAGQDAITLIDLPRNGQPAAIACEIAVDSPVERLIAADQKLFAVTMEGQILAFGEGNPTGNTAPVRSADPVLATEETQTRVSRLLSAGDAQGYAFWFGKAGSPLASYLANHSPFVQLAIIDNDAAAIDRMRRRLDEQGKYGMVTVHQSEWADFAAPKYVANLVFVELSEDGLSNPDHALEKVYQSVRPYGGVLHLLVGAEDRAEVAEHVKAMNLEQANVTVGPESVIVRRVGKLPGSASWTHQHGNIANTVKSDDARVKLPLGVLWFGGSSNMDVLPRHGHGPPEQVIGGRLFIQGMNCLSARDVYTGRVLWKREFKDLGTFDVFYDKTYENTPLNPKYNQVHIPGANGRGTNYVVTEDFVYILEGGVCHALDPATGETVKDFRLPTAESGQSEEWGYIGVYNDVLIGGVGFANYRARQSLTFESDKQLKSSKAGFGSKSLDRAASLALVGFDRHSGEQLWKVDARHSFWHNGIVAGGGKVYCLDKNPKQIEEMMRRRGKSLPDSYRIVAFDHRSGEVAWEVKENIFGTWLGYSAQHDVLLQAGARASDRLTAETAAGMAVYHGSDGSVVWKNDTLGYAGPCILHNDLIITNANSYSESAGAFYLLTGKQKMVRNALTGQMQPWKVTRAYGCNNIIASENLLTFRSGAAGFYDLLTNAGTGNLGGFKSGCTSNLVVADGVLNAPDYTRTCSCAYQNQTSLALVHMPSIDTWTVGDVAAEKLIGQPIRKMGINFGAPGDRRGPRGLMWLEHPVVAGKSPPVSIKLSGEAKVFQHHSSSMLNTELPWVFSSGVQQVTDIRIRTRLTDESDASAGITINHTDDDAEENEQGDVNLGSSDLELVRDSGIQVIGMRFNQINLARGAKVQHASIQFTCDETSDEPTTLILTAEDTGNAERFSSDPHDVTERTSTEAEVDWQPPPWKTKGEAAEAQRTPDLASLVQAVIDRDDWKPGNSIVFLVNGTGKRVASSSKGGKKVSPRLFIQSDSVLASDPGQAGERYDVRLHFAAPPPIQGVRKFDVLVQGKTVVSDLTLDSTGEHGKQHVSHTLSNVSLDDQLHVQLVPKQGEPIISGIELTRSDARF